MSEGRLYRNVLDGDGGISHAAWLRARAEGRFVGECRRCDDKLIPQPPHDHSGRIDYQADCRGCDYSVLAPGGRVLHGSARLSQRR